MSRDYAPSQSDVWFIVLEIIFLHRFVGLEIFSLGNMIMFAARCRSIPI
jgi:hypothetical protein